MSDYISSLCRCLDGGISPYHTVSQAARFLKTHEFVRLPLGEKFHLQPRGRYYVEDGTFLAAFTVGSRPDRFRIAASHTDWPCFRIKPEPEIRVGGCLKLSVENYGGGIFSTWLDRPLSLAGVVMLPGERPDTPVARLISWEEPLLTIPSLAIHMNREANKGTPLNPALDMLPLCETVKEGLEADGFLLRRIAEKLSVREQDILSFELYVYCADKAQLVGFDRYFLSSPRLDNLTSFHANIMGIIDSDSEGINMAVLYDNEEIGSNTRRGGDSSTLRVIMEKIALSLGMDREAFLDACLNGLFLSCDAAHAAHPNHMGYADGPNAPLLNWGVALKKSPRYSSTAETCAVMEGLARANRIPLQTFMNRADLSGGGTLGSMASAILAMPSVDVGVPILAMHSARELMGVKDQKAFCRLCRAFFTDHQTWR